MKGHLLLFTAYMTFNGTALCQPENDIINNNPLTADEWVPGNSATYEMHNGDNDYLHLLLPPGVLKVQYTTTASVAMRTTVYQSANIGVSEELNYYYYTGWGTIYTCTTIPGGDYYIRFEDQQNSGTYSYDIEITFDASDECEFNNFFATACPVTTDASFNAQIWGYNQHTPSWADVDIYRLDLAQPQAIAITVADAPVDIDIDLYTSTDTTTAFAHAYNGTGSISLTEELSAGVTYVRIGEHGNNATDQPPYTITFGTPIGISDPGPTSELVIVADASGDLVTVTWPLRFRASSVEVLDATGRIVSLQVSLAPSGCELDLGTSPDGVYLVMVRFSDGERAVERIVKQ